MDIKFYWRWHSCFIGFEFGRGWNEGLVFVIQLLWLKIQIETELFTEGDYVFYCTSPLIAFFTALFAGGNCQGSRVSSLNRNAMLQAYKILNAWGMVDNDLYSCLPTTDSQPYTEDDIPF